jgi:glycosyltransferase involved in cell wall biosynthesis
MRRFIVLGHKVYIACPTERKFKQPTNVIESSGAQILSVKTLNIQKTNVVEKGLGTLSLEYLFGRAIKKYWGDVDFDLVLYTTPPITFNKVIQDVKQHCGARSYLLLKDIFPQNAVDLHMMSERSIIHKIFRKKEETLYAISDKIGCMSPANMQYVLDHNPGVSPEKVELCPNSIELVPQSPLSESEEQETRSKLCIPYGKTLFIYGGNLGKPQGIDFLLHVIEANEANEHSFIMIVGSGTEYGKMQRWFNENNPKNAKLMSALPKTEYDNLIKAADVGLVFLDPRFTIPNYPSRILSYMENKMPILLATDVNTDIGPIAEANGYGYWCESGDLATFLQYINTLASDAHLRATMGEAGYNYLCNNYLVEQTVETILKG